MAVDRADRNLGPERAPRPALRKAYGQHHLRSGALCGPLLDFLGLPAGSGLAVEIGPGGGVLTRELLARGFRVLALELDRSWALHLHSECRDPGLQIAVADALGLDWRRVPSDAVVAGNLPYQISTALIGCLLGAGAAGLRVSFLVQREVADRLAARPGTTPYGALSVLAAARGGARTLGRVAPGSFRPPPKVDSAFVGLELSAPPFPSAEWPAFEDTVRAAFRSRRKTLRNSLGQSVGRERSEEMLAAAGLDGRVRAQELGVASFVQLHRVRRHGR